MFIRDNNRFNTYASATIAGVTYPNFTDPVLREQLGITEIPDPTPPEDYTEETYYRTEQDTAPYVVYTKKSQEQLDAQANAKAVAEAKAYLAETDFKMLPDYTPSPDATETLDEIKANRAEARELIRSLSV